jgi:hypothetical protein
MFYQANDFTVVKTLDNGIKVEYTFTSSAQARQFMESHAGAKPPARTVKPSRGRGQRSSKPRAPKNANEATLRAEALKQFKGL